MDALAPKAALSLLEDMAAGPPRDNRLVLSRSLIPQLGLDLAQQHVGRHGHLGRRKKEINVGTPERVVQLREHFCACIGIENIFFGAGIVSRKNLR